MDMPWLSHYPPEVPAEVDTHHYASLVHLLEDAFQRHRDAPAFKFMGRTWSYGEIDAMSQAFAAFLQSRGLERGDRVAVMMPNVPQYAVAVCGILRAGLAVVNVNPLYTARELHHQLRDANTRAVVILENFAAVLQEAQAELPPQDVVVASVGDLLGPLKGRIVNHVVRRVRKQVPAWELPGALRFNEALRRGRAAAYRRPQVRPDDLAALQYTGGTTGVSKGAMLLHRNLVANVEQCEAWFRPAREQVRERQFVMVAALPLYHVFGFTVGMLLSLRTGACSLLIANPRDLPALLKDLARQPVHSFPAVNTLFQALLNHPDFGKVDWRQLKVCVGGGMAVQQATAQAWLEKTGCAVCQGYGLSETSPVAACNPVTVKGFDGTIGVPVPGTEMAVFDDDGQPLPPGRAGEIGIRGPQVMAGYWQRPQETAQVLRRDGFFLTGDIGVMEEDGRFRIVDRKKDMILVSGFNVYPNEIEDVVSQMPGVLECAATSVPDARTGEAVKLVVVPREAGLSEADVRHWCEQRLTGYKRPKIVEFRNFLPKTNVGKVLRRELRGEPVARAS